MKEACHWEVWSRLVTQVHDITVPQVVLLRDVVSQNNISPPAGVIKPDLFVEVTGLGLTSQSSPQSTACLSNLACAKVIVILSVFVTNMQLSQEPECWHSSNISWKKKTCPHFGEQEPITYGQTFAFLETTFDLIFFLELLSCSLEAWAVVLPSYHYYQYFAETCATWMWSDARF